MNNYYNRNCFLRSSYLNRHHITKTRYDSKKKLFTDKSFTPLDPCEGNPCRRPYAVCAAEGGRPVCRCSLACPDTVRYVCGSDGRTYDNECQLRRDSCRSNTRITVSSAGRCRGMGDDGVCMLIIMIIIIIKIIIILFDLYCACYIGDVHMRITKVKYF